LLPGSSLGTQVFEAPLRRWQDQPAIVERAFKAVAWRSMSHVKLIQEDWQNDVGQNDKNFVVRPWSEFDWQSQSTGPSLRVSPDVIRDLDPEFFIVLPNIILPTPHLA
jgi:hypothetical protein